VTYDVVIVGGDPAGASAAIFAGRAACAPRWSTTERGWPQGAREQPPRPPEGIEGPELLALGRRQGVVSGAERIEDAVTSLSASDGVLALTALTGSLCWRGRCCSRRARRGAPD